MRSHDPTKRSAQGARDAPMSWLAIGLLLFAFAPFDANRVARAADADATLPVILNEDFESGMDHWQTTDPIRRESVWEVIETATEPGQTGNHALRVTGASKYEPPHRSPLEHRLAQGREGRRLRVHGPRPKHESQRRRSSRPVRLLGPSESVGILLRPLRRQGRSACLPDLHRQQQRPHDDHPRPGRRHALDRRLAQHQGHRATTAR